MDLATGNLLNSEVYLENVYQGKLGATELSKIQNIDWNRWFNLWLMALAADSKVVQQDYELSLRLTNDEQMQQFNHQYRSLDRPTDVLAFAAAEDEIQLPEDLVEPAYLGDIIISLDTAAYQAVEQQHSLSIELAWLASHGLLHLLGWDHPDDVSLSQMLAQQLELIKLLDILSAD